MNKLRDKLQRGKQISKPQIKDENSTSPKRWYELSIKEIAFAGIYLAFLLILTFVPQTGYISVSVISITTIPCFIALATWHIGGLGTIVTALGFGFGSWFKALAGIGSPLFANFPELAILPRALMGVFIYLIYKALGELKIWKISLTAALCVILNTILVTSFYFLVSTYREGEFRTFKAWMILIWLNFVVELPVGIVIGTALAPLVKNLRKQVNDFIRYEW